MLTPTSDIDSFVGAIARFRETIEHEAELCFSLKYDGLLLSSSDKHTRVKNKNQIRWYLADQIDALTVKGDFSRIPEEFDRERPIEERVANFKGYYFYAAISKGPIACNLAIRIERPGLPGSLFEHDGDLDNRLKTLLDALKVPRNENEVTVRWTRSSRQRSGDRKVKNPARVCLSLC
jgi:hypothetical protein